MALFFGSVMAFLTPPIQTPDENSHLTRAIMVSEGRIFAREQGGAWGQDVPASLAAYVDSHMYLAHSDTKRFSYQRWYTDSHAPHANEPRVFRTYSAQSASPVLYIPQVLGIWVGKALYAVTPVQFNWAAAGYFARLGNLFAYAFVFALAIRTLPRFAAILTFTALTPMSLSLAASASYDVLVILVAVGFLVAVFKVATAEAVPSRAWTGSIFLLSFLLGHSKIVYAPVLLTLTILIPRMGFIRWTTLAIACVLLAMLGAVLGAGLFGLPQDASLKAGISEQLAYLVTNWSQIPSLLVRSALHFSSFHFISSIGNLGWLDANFPLPLVVLWAGVALLAVTVDASKGQPPSFHIAAAAMGGGVLIALVALYLALYVTWTSITTGVGAPFIDGVQGRYLLPLFPYALGTLSILLGFVTQRITATSATLMSIQLVLAAAFLTLTQFMLLLRYWIPAASH